MKGKGQNLNHCKSLAKLSERFSAGINDSYCPSCLAAIAPMLLKHEGITKVTVLHARNQIIIAYNSGIINHRTVKKTLESAIAEDIETDVDLRSAMDPVCKMTVKTNVDSFYSDHNGRRYYFCARSCKLAFEEDPSHFEDISLSE